MRGFMKDVERLRHESQEISDVFREQMKEVLGEGLMEEGIVMVKDEMERMKEEIKRNDEVSLRVLEGVLEVELMKDGVVVAKEEVERLVPEFILGDGSLTIVERKRDLVELEKMVEFMRTEMINDLDEDDAIDVGCVVVSDEVER